MIPKLHFEECQRQSVWEKIKHLSRRARILTLRHSLLTSSNDITMNVQPMKIAPDYITLVAYIIRKSRRTSGGVCEKLHFGIKLQLETLIQINHTSFRMIT